MAIDFTQAGQRTRKRLRKILAPLQKFADLRKSAEIDVSQIRSVCLLLGPYRNLTTLTASILALHPNCQVLNHAGVRIIGDPRLDFLRSYTDKKFLDFMKFAVRISQGGSPGMYGGSILFSHAFGDGYPMRHLYSRRYRDSLVKEKIQSLFWKESLQISKHIEAGSDLADIFTQNQMLRFMMPVRNPIDCALSNLSTGHIGFFPGLVRTSGVKEVITAILDEFAWFMGLRTAHPERFYYFFEHELADPKLLEIASYLGLEDDAVWRRDAQAAFVDRSRSKYAHDAELVKFYAGLVEQKFADHPHFRLGLLKFAQ
jgi:hypothetical protein